MKIHREGYKILINSTVSVVVLNLIIIILFPEPPALWISTIAFSIITLCFMLYFFRNPRRKAVIDPGKILIPADGVIVAIEERVENEYFKDKRLQVSVFMTIFDVHSNRFPVSGTVKYIKHHPGKYFIANCPKSSIHNESSSVVIETEQGLEIMVRQIAGAVARRIVTYAEEGTKVMQGDELGFIKFGSRVDVFLPPGTKLEVDLNQKVHASTDIMAIITNNNTNPDTYESKRKN